MDVCKYLANQYGVNGCFDLVCDVYRNECSTVLPDFGEYRALSQKEFAQFIRIALHEEKIRSLKLEQPEDLCIVLMGVGNNPHHCGVYYSGNVLHSLQSMTISQPLHTIKDTYRNVEFWRYTNGEN